MSTPSGTGSGSRGFAHGGIDDLANVVNFESPINQKLVAVTGDLILNTNLFTVPANPNLSSGPWPTPHREDMIGGSHYLFQLIKGCWSPESEADQPEVILMGHSKLLPEQAISLWHPFAKTSSSRAAEQEQKQELVWRISNTLLATFPVSTELGASRKLEQKYKAYVESLTEQVDQTHSNLESIASVIAIDDANLGYRSSRSTFVQLDASVFDGCQLILKTRSPLYDSVLWNHLENQQKLKDQLTVVVSVESLRIAGIEVPRSKSWDEFLEDLSILMKSRPMRRMVAACNRIVVSLPNTAIAVFSSGELEHLIYHPAELEDQWRIAHPGRTEGSTSIVTAAVCRSFLTSRDFETFPENGKRALEASKYSHLTGGGEVKDTPASESWFAGRLTKLIADVASKLASEKPTEFASLSQAGVIGPLQETEEDRKARRSSILSFLVGSDHDEVLELAVEIVNRGLEPEERGIPYARFEKYSTVNRSEIEKANQIADLIRNYGLKKDQRPLSLAVFGQPGSGKSFSVEQIAGALMGESKVLTYNLSQLEKERELKHPFDEIRHESVRGQIPLVFWDEFDSGKYKWLKSFLAPMQDSIFASDGLEYPFGRAIFVFAGGMTTSFNEFLSKHLVSNSSGDKWSDKAKTKKIPDFVSRLRGYLDIEGVDQRDNDLNHLVRRAIILRKALVEHASHLTRDAASGEASIDPYVTRAFLMVPHYRHGARSIDALVSMSSLQTATKFGVEQLPSREQMDLHTTKDLRALAHKIQMADDTVQLSFPFVATETTTG